MMRKRGLSTLLAAVLLLLPVLGAISTMVDVGPVGAAGAPPSITLTPYPDDPTNDEVWIEIDAVADDEAGGNRIDALRWADGVRNASYFATGGTDVLDDGEFEVTRNGTYTVYARDTADNEAIETITVSNIDKDGPTLTLRPSTTEPTSGSVTVEVDASDSSGIDEVRWSDEAPQMDSPWPSHEVIDGEFVVTENGTYTVIAFDKANNQTMRQIAIDNILPELSLTLRSSSSGGKATVTAEPIVLGNGNSLEALLWAAGDLPLPYFREGASEDITAANRFDVASLGTYTVYARDTNGNEVIKTIRITTLGSSSSSSASASSSSSLFIATMNGKQAAVSLRESAASGSGTQLVYELNLDDPAELAALASPDGKNELRVALKDPASHPIDGVSLRLSQRTLSRLAGLNAKLTLDIGAAAYEWPIKTLASASEDPVLRLTALRQSADADQALADANAAGADDWRAELAGIPAEIEAGGASASAEDSWLVLPLPSGLASADLGKLAVFLKNRDGTGTIVPGTIRYDSQGQAAGIAVRPGAFARAAVLKAEPIKTRFDRYANGYADGSFGTGKPITRAELASMLAKLSAASGSSASGDNSGSGAAAFQDVPASFWAAKAIAQAAAAGWMSGDSEGRFRPNDSLTRAELASVLVRWRKEQAPVGGGTRFPDAAASHWAFSAIAAAAGKGWMTGYTDGSFKPDQDVTRAEAVTVLNRALGRPSPSDGPSWSDVADTYWAAAAIRSASQSFDELRYLNGKVELLVR
ncbi:S-layer homology domain-containing protein [Cohnella sp. AR92]|uniref:S-layer homology domain-containing protein n=1 Tax=Cohnella sp. AR92 TaxID=648716 RepID=UPI000F8CAA75|nr:S-layer homology domain-containing protein [Cohnella sp. AR92]RUS45135.1 S-layer homology domain-containing protein [Cohnella sp. AR92]